MQTTIKAKINIKTLLYGINYSVVLTLETVQKLALALDTLRSLEEAFFVIEDDKVSIEFVYQGSEAIRLKSAVKNKSLDAKLVVTDDFLDYYLDICRICLHDGFVRNYEPNWDFHILREVFDKEIFEKRLVPQNINLFLNFPFEKKLEQRG